MEQEITAYKDDRNRQFAVLLEKQRRELAQIDTEITNLGINVAELAESMQDIHFFSGNSSMQKTPPPPASSSSHNRTSMVSLQRSYSSNSFLSNTTNNGNGTTTATSHQ